MAAPGTPPQPGQKKKHLPAVGIIGLALIAAALGSVYYTQFILPHNTACTIAPIHRVYIMTAIVQDIPNGGFQVKAIYQTNITGTLPLNSTGLPDVTGQPGNYTKLAPRSNSKEVFGNVGDTISVYITSINSTIPPQYPSIPGHGFEFNDKSLLKNLNVTGSGTNNSTPIVVKFGDWFGITFQYLGQGTSGFFCTVVCSGEHGNMKGTLTAGCG